MNVAQHGMKVAHRSEAPTMQRSVQSCGDAAGGISARNAKEINFGGMFWRVPEGVVK